MHDENNSLPMMAVPGGGYAPYAKTCCTRENAGKEVLIEE